ncbi:helix-turn-helix domain-containing protein [Methyloversatilis discipulorum]|uniref:helix-turn-helix domain-containing protein n=1 Tax=Methyloversatilis discipulorum TaxID=1119528 RepID=UPI000374F514|nr:helix-turn-helix domain-containing protein [Methyloversatilis discipulorum]
MTTEKSDATSQRAVVRAMRIMKLLKGQTDLGVSLRQLAKALGENDSTVLNTLRAMEGEEMVMQYDKTNHWALSIACMQIHAATDAELTRIATRTAERRQRINAAIAEVGG